MDNKVQAGPTGFRQQYSFAVRSATKREQSTSGSLGAGSNQHQCCRTCFGDKRTKRSCANKKKVKIYSGITLEPAMVSEGRPCTLITSPLALTQPARQLYRYRPRAGRRAPNTPRGERREEGAARPRRPPEEEEGGEGRPAQGGARPPGRGQSKNS